MESILDSMLELLLHSDDVEMNAEMFRLVWARDADSPTLYHQ